ncbi:MAG: uridine diphosphate-N-acetylglucosamine-binding protein YvcK, partial [Cyanobacteriota bacterium]
MVTNLKNKKLVTIGNGTGQSTILKHLQTHIEDISVIVGVTDNGGHSGLLRRIMNIPAPGDIRNCMSAVSNPDNILTKLLGYRFIQDELSGHSLGNLIISALVDIEGDLGKAVKKLTESMGIKAKIYPSTIESTQICAELENGEIIEGEFEIIRRSNNHINIVRLFHNPPVKAYAPCIDAVNNADIIVISPGTLRTGIISTLLANGMQEAMSATKARIIFICNIMTNPGQTEGFSTQDHIDEITKYLGRKPDYALIHSGDIPQFVQEIYLKERSYPVKHMNIEHRDIKIIMEDLLEEINEQEIKRLQRINGKDIKTTPHIIRH